MILIPSTKKLIFNLLQPWFSDHLTPISNLTAADMVKYIPRQKFDIASKYLSDNRPPFFSKRPHSVTICTFYCNKRFTFGWMWAQNKLTVLALLNRYVCHNLISLYNMTWKINYLRYDLFNLCFLLLMMRGTCTFSNFLSEKCFKSTRIFLLKYWNYIAPCRNKSLNIAT